MSSDWTALGLHHPRHRAAAPGGGLPVDLAHRVALRVVAQAGELAARGRRAAAARRPRFTRSSAAPESSSRLAPRRSGKTATARRGGHPALVPHQAQRPPHAHGAASPEARTCRAWRASPGSDGQRAALRTSQRAPPGLGAARSSSGTSSRSRSCTARPERLIEVRARCGWARPPESLGRAARARRAISARPRQREVHAAPATQQRQRPARRPAVQSPRAEKPAAIVGQAEQRTSAHPEALGGNHLGDLDRVAPPP